MNEHASLDEILERIEAVLTGLSFVDDGTAATAYTVADRQDQRAHLGLTVWAPSSRDTDQMDGHTDIWVEDSVTVTLAVQVPRTPGQNVTRRAATEHEARIRSAIESDGELQCVQPRWTGSERTPSPDRAWLDIVQTFTVQRIESVRRVA